MKIANADAIENWIFVTGVIRSGTTFVGKILSSPLQVDYIHEPFNTGCGMKGMNERYRYVRPDLGSSEMKAIHARTKKIFSYDFTLKSSVYRSDPWYKKVIKSMVGSRGPFYLRLAKLNPFHRAAVIKDPTGSLMAEYLYKRFGVQPVIVIRHPVSLVASFDRLDWWPETGLLFDQAELVKDHLSGAAFTDYAKQGNVDKLTESCVHWCIVNSILLKWAEEYNWTVVTHEDLCQNPLSQFEKLYRDLNLPWSNRVQARIIKLTNSSSAKTRNNEVQNFKRNSEKIFTMRRASVTPSDRQRIFDITKDVALKIYSIDSFSLAKEV